MAFIKLNNEMPGIVGLLWNKPSTGKRLSNLAQTILKGKSPLTSGEREMIASYVSSLNQCKFCCNSHSAAAAFYISNPELIEKVKENVDAAPISDKMKALLKLAGKVQQMGNLVTPSDIELARSKGATDEEIHDAVLVAAAFCMYNRYVDGLGTLEPEDKEEYKDMGVRLGRKGYKLPPGFIRRMVNKMYIRERNAKRSKA